MCFPRATYPHLFNKFLFTASLTIFLGTIKEMREVEDLVFDINLKVKQGELINFPSLKIFSTVFLPALFFLGSIIKNS